MVKVIQNSPVAGFQYYDGEQIWAYLGVGDLVQLIREINNPYDKYAVEIYWKDRKLGYVSRGQNKAVAQLLDNGAILTAQISNRQYSDSPMERLEIEIRLID